MKKLQPTNEDNTHKLESKARAALLAGISRDWEAAESAAKEAGHQTVVGINKLRAVGEKLKQLCQHEQITLEFFMSVQAKLPASMRYQGARAAMHVSSRLEKDVETAQQAMMVQRDLFAALLDYKEPKRIGQQTAHEANPWSEFVSGASSFTSLFNGLGVDQMDTWDRMKLGKFVETTAPIVEKHQRARELMGV